MSHLTKSLLKGSLKDAKLFSSNPRQRPHYHLLVEANGQQFDVALNVASDAHAEDVEVLYAIKQDIIPPQVDALLQVPHGMFNLPTQGLVGIDYVRDKLVAKNEMKLLPLFNPSEPIEHQGNADVKELVEEMINTPDAVLYAFGHRYEQRSPRNAAWGFQPDDGIHNIHMNQGNYPGNHDDENGREEDGALFIYFPSIQSWSAVYVAFQTQSFDNGPDGYPKDDPRHGTSGSGFHRGDGRHHHHATNGN